MKKMYKWIAGLILLGFVAAGLFLTLAPDEIPAHYNLQGQVDRWGSKFEYLIFPFINLLFGAFMVWMAKREGKQGRERNEKTVASVTVWVLVLFHVMWIFFMFKAIDPTNLGGELGDAATKLVMILLCGSFIPLGNIMPKAQRNSLFGLRTKWSMANDWCWQQSQRFGGYVFVITGVLGVMICALLPAQWGGYALLFLVIAMTVICTYASYRIYRKDQGK